MYKRPEIWRNARLYHKMDIFLLCFKKQKYAPSVFEKYITTISLGGKEIKLNLYDTAGKTVHEKSPSCCHICHAFFLLSVHNIMMWSDLRVWCMSSVIAPWHCVRNIRQMNNVTVIIISIIIILIIYIYILRYTKVRHPFTVFSFDLVFRHWLTQRKW